MGIANNTVFNSTVAAYGSWIDLAHYSDWSLHVTGLETGGQLNIFISNEPFKPKDGQVDSNAVSLTQITSTTNNNAFYQGSGVAHWMQIQKVPGTTPTQTIVNLFAQMV